MHTKRTRRKQRPLGIESLEQRLFLHAGHSVPPLSETSVEKNSPAAHTRTWDGDGAPEINLTVREHRNGGLDLRIDPKNFRFGQESDMVHSPGVGHTHVYVDGVKITRFYGSRFHLSGIDRGKHKIEVRLSSNDHHEYVHNRRYVTDSAQLRVTRLENTMPWDGRSNPDISLRVRATRNGSLRLNVDVSNIKLSDENQLGHRPGAGHTHIYLNSQKITRFYGNRFTLSGLAPGKHTIQVRVSSDSHKEYAHRGNYISDSIKVAVKAKRVIVGYDEVLAQLSRFGAKKLRRSFTDLL